MHSPAKARRLIVALLAACYGTALAQERHENAKLTASDASAGDTFSGTSVSISGDTMVIERALDDCAAGADCGSAYVFIFNGVDWVQQAKLTASDAAAGDVFGASVSISGDTIVVGAPYHDCGAFGNCGSAYVFVKPGGGWSDMTQTAKLTTTDLAQQDYFGGSVSISGDVIVVGANGDDCGTSAAARAGDNASCGSAYVFVKPGGGWTDMAQTAKLTASDGSDAGPYGDRFGYSVSISGDTIVAGAYGDDCAAGTLCGSAYVFVKPGGGWADMTQTGKLTASDAADEDHFGISVSVGGDTIVAGAWGDECGVQSTCGSAYVFVKPGGGWADMTQTAKLSASDAAADDYFGIPASISGETIVVGAYGDDCGAGLDCGSAYVFIKPAGGWNDITQTAKLTASDAAGADYFGFPVCVSGDTIVAGAYGDDCGAGADCGSAYVFQPQILFVNSNAPGLNNGRSWVNAYTKLQDALAVALPGDEIWVAKGTYKPAGPGGSRSATFQLVNNVALYGGFVGGESSRDLRDPEHNVTILSGDLNGDDTPVACVVDSDCNALRGGLCDDGFCIIRDGNGENSYNVVRSNMVDATAVLDGFTIRAGKAIQTVPDPLPVPPYGAGMLNQGGNPTVNNCTFTGNLVSHSGGGMANLSGSNPTVTNCTFRGNSGSSGGGMGGGGSPTVINCTFSRNSAIDDPDPNGGDGGGASFDSGSPVVINCTFIENSTDGFGGGIKNESDNLTVTNCTFSGNTASDGGGMLVYDTGAGEATVINSTFIGNTTSGNGGGVASSNALIRFTNCTFGENTAQGTGGGLYSSISNATSIFKNSVLWGNSDAGGTGESAQISRGAQPDDGYFFIDYTIVKGWTGTLPGLQAPGTGNSGSDPLFVDADGADNIAGTADDDLRLQSGSPAIDTGDTTALPLDIDDLDDDGNTTERTSLDVGGNPRILDDPLTVGASVDMGANEYASNCDGNGIPDGCDIDCGAADGPCDISGCGLGADCDGNDILDACDIFGCDSLNPDYPGCDDCNLNGRPDGCDISLGSSLDVEIPIGVPDECTEPNAGADWSDDIWDLTAPEPYPDNINPNAVPDLHVTIGDGFTLLLDVTVEVDSVRILEGATLNVTDTGDGDLSIAATAPPVTPLLKLSGDLLLANDRVVSVPTDALSVEPGGRVTKLPGAGTTTAIISAAEVAVLGAACDSGQVSGNITLADNMTLESTGKLILDGAVSLCPEACAGLGQTFIAPPPKVRLPGNIRVACMDDFKIVGAVDVLVDSTQAVEVGGDFDNQSVVPSLFVWINGKLELNGTGAQTFEVAGINLGQNTQGFLTDQDTICDSAQHTNYSMGSVEVASGANVTFVNRFANTASIGCGEALYVHNLIFQSGATVTIDNCKVYYETLTDNGVNPTLIGCGELLSVSAPPTVMPEPVIVNKNRGLAMSVPPPSTAGPGAATALRIAMVELQNPVPPNLPQNPPPDFSAYEFAATCTDPGGCARWVGKPRVYLESQDTPGIGSFKAARLQCTPLYQDWTTEGLFYVVGSEITPSSKYDVQQFAGSCVGKESTCTAASSPLRIATGRYGDVEAPFNPPSTTTQPNAIDVTQLVNKFKNATGALSKPLAQLQPNLPELNADISALDIVAVVDAVKQFAYPFSGPCPCPSAVTCNTTPCATPGVCVTTYGAGSMCVKTCNGGANLGDPCINNTHCPGGACSNGFCRDRCGRCSP